MTILCQVKILIIRYFTDFQANDVHRNKVLLGWWSNDESHRVNFPPEWIPQASGVWHSQSRRLT